MDSSVTQEIELLSSIALFGGVNQVDLQQIARSARRRKHEADRFLFYEGDPAEAVYVLLEGRIKLSQVTPDGQQVILHYVVPGEAFAVIAVLSESVYPVTAQTIEASLTMGWEKSVMYQLMEQHPKIALNSIRILASRVREFQDRVRELSTEKVERRIARALLRLARQTGRKIEEGVLIDLPLSRQDLAQMTGTTLFTVSRTLSQWEAKGLIQSGREKVVIRFPHGLVSIAEDLPYLEEN